MWHRFVNILFHVIFFFFAIHTAKYDQIYTHKKWIWTYTLKKALEEYYTYTIFT